MSYLVLARKYRPQTFEEVVGQSHVTTTLANAVMAGRLAHAILFSGPRGTGKTTVARILAKTLNCEKNREEPSAIPCNTCRSCLEITNGSAVDVFEIDGASNNNVDQIRELRDNVKYMPAHSPYKIYIIDEVHMLSIAAFNALLKTLEEPPPHVKFMFATTEIHKIPITILSRCQRHDMKRVDLDTLTAHLEYLCSLEGVSLEQKSLSLIAQEAGGSVRDALSLLDQVTGSGTGNTIGHDQVVDILGTVDRKNLYDLSIAIIKRDIPDVLDLIDSIYNRGHDLKKLYAKLTEHFRNLLIVKIAKNYERLVDVTKHEHEQIADLVKNVPDLYITQILDLLFAEEPRIRYSAQPRFALEMTLIKVLQVPPALSIDSLIEKIDQLKEGITPEYPDLNEHIKTSETDFRPQTAASAPESSKTRQNKIYEPAAEHEYNISSEQHQRNVQSTKDDVPPDRPSNIPPGYNPGEPLDISWDRFRTWFAASCPQLTPSLTQSKLKELSDKKLVVEIGGSSFNLNRLSQDRTKSHLELNLRNFFRTGAPLTLVQATSELPDTRKEKKEQNDSIKRETLNNPVVAEAVRIFDGSIDIIIP